MRISDWSSDVCSSDLSNRPWHCRVPHKKRCADNSLWPVAAGGQCHSFSILPYAPLPPNPLPDPAPPAARLSSPAPRSCKKGFQRRQADAAGSPRHDAFHRTEEHTSDTKSLMRSPKDGLCLEQKTTLHTT